MSKVAFGCVDRKKGPYCFDVFRSRDQYMISFFEERKCSSARTGSGCQTCLTGRGGECRGHIPPSLGILSHTRDNSATNPWWPPADKHTAVKRYDILSLRELRRGSRGNVRARREKSIFANDTMENHCAAYLYYYRPRENIRNASSFRRIRIFRLSFESSRLFSKFEILKFS